MREGDCALARCRHEGRDETFTLNSASLFVLLVGVGVQIFVGWGVGSGGVQITRRGIIKKYRAGMRLVFGVFCVCCFPYMMSQIPLSHTISRNHSRPGHMPLWQTHTCHPSTPVRETAGLDPS